MFKFSGSKYATLVHAFRTKSDVHVLEWGHMPAACGLHPTHAKIRAFEGNASAHVGDVLLKQLEQKLFVGSYTSSCSENSSI